MKGCVVCNAQVTTGELYVREKENNKRYYDGIGQLNFQQLVTGLIPNPAEDYKEKMIEGCQLFFPDTVFFEKGKIVICGMDKDFCLIKDAKRPTALAVRKHLDTQIAERKEKSDKFWLQEACNARKRNKARADKKDNEKPAALSAQKTHDRLAKAKPEVTVVKKGQQNYSKDHAIVRYTMLTNLDGADPDA